jgi:hypothetical protein
MEGSLQHHLSINPLHCWLIPKCRLLGFRSNSKRMQHVMHDGRVFTEDEVDLSKQVLFMQLRVRTP